MDEHLGADILVTNRDVSALPTGDVETVAGRGCLAQDLAHRLGTPRGSLWRHGEYGLDVARYLQCEMTDVHVQDLVQSVQLEAEADPRVVIGSARCTVQARGLDGLRLRLAVTPIGSTNPLNIVLVFNPRTGVMEVPSA